MYQIFLIIMVLFKNVTFKSKIGYYKSYFSTIKIITPNVRKKKNLNEKEVVI